MTVTENTDIDYLTSSPDIFNSFVYTNINSAVAILDQRRNDLSLEKYVKNYIPNLPHIININDRIAFLSRDVATPNNETIKFIDLANKNKLRPLFWEYYDDRFSPNVNITKHSLAKMMFYLGLDKKNNDKVRGATVVDFNLYNSKKISEVKTLWGESLVDFHHALFGTIYSTEKSKEFLFFDASGWYHELGGEVSVYYKYILLLFIKNGILFEDFVLDDIEEILFIRKVFLKAFIDIYLETGLKPLICPLNLGGKNPNFSMYYPDSLQNIVRNKINLI